MRFAAMQPLSGKFYSSFNTKWTFLIFFFVFEVGSLICGAAISSNMFIAGQCVAGLGASGLFNGSVTITAASVPLEKRPMYQGIMLGRFYINLPIGAVVAAALVFIRIPEITPKPTLSVKVVRELIPELDLLGFALFAPAAVMFLLALQLGGAGSYEWGSSVVIGLFVGAAVTAILFILWERRMGDSAMMPGSLLRQRIVTCSFLHFGLLLSTVSVASYYLPTYFQAIRGDGATMSGVDMLPSILSQLFFIGLAGGLVKSVGYYLPFAVLSGLLNSVGNGLLSTLSISTSTGKWIGYQIITGAGRGLGLQMGMVAVQNAVTDEQTPVAMALLMFSQNFLGATLLICATTLFDSSLQKEVAQHAPSVSYASVLAAGADPSSLRSLVPEGGSELTGLLLAYSNSIDKIFYLVTGLAGASFFVAFGLGWKDVRPKKVPEEALEA
ncbi:hypothetical protein SLS53_001084 [Cytospora paraplurivora]|uniref:Uncharacterized protein n=1 Tax=Cytospora paraplurivora TaxID=2898453 RepID=A0AAN9UJP4_9PEZI